MQVPFFVAPVHIDDTNLVASQIYMKVDIYMTLYIHTYPHSL